MPFQNSNAGFRRIERNMRRNAEVVQVYPANRCSCGLDINSLASNRSDANCTICGGYGIYYLPPKTILGVVTGYDVRTNPQDMAVTQPGDLMLAPLPRSKVWINDFDKIVLPKWEDGEALDAELVLRGTGASDTVRHPIVKVDACSQVTANPYTLTQYQLGTDFTVSGKTITWLANHGPLPGQAYALRYRTRLEWIAMLPPNARYLRGTNVGQRVLLRQRELVWKAGAAAPDGGQP